VNKWTRRFIQVAANAFFVLGSLFIPFGFWLGEGSGSIPALGWVIQIGSILIPWTIGYWLARIGFRENLD
jgi:hypothetical protein